jgi:hypothetical protein
MYLSGIITDISQSVPGECARFQLINIGSPINFRYAILERTGSSEQKKHKLSLCLHVTFP